MYNIYHANKYYVYYMPEYVNICNRESLNTGKRGNRAFT